MIWNFWNRYRLLSTKTPSHIFLFFLFICNILFYFNTFNSYLFALFKWSNIKMSMSIFLNIKFSLIVIKLYSYQSSKVKLYNVPIKLLHKVSNSKFCYNEEWWELAIKLKQNISQTTIKDDKNQKPWNYYFNWVQFFFISYCRHSLFHFIIYRYYK